MNNLVRPAVGILRRNISTSNKLFAIPSGNELKKNVNSKTLQYIVAAGIAGGIAFAYYEYQNGAMQSENDADKK